MSSHFVLTTKKTVSPKKHVPATRVSRPQSWSRERGEKGEALTIKRARKAWELRNMPYSPRGAHSKSLASCAAPGPPHRSAPHRFSNATIRLIIACFKSNAALRFYLVFPYIWFSLKSRACPVALFKNVSGYFYYFMWVVEYKKVYLAKGETCVRGVMRRVVLVAVFWHDAISVFGRRQIFRQNPCQQPPAYPAFLLFSSLSFITCSFFFDSSLASKQMPLPSLISTWASVCSHWKIYNNS